MLHVEFEMTRENRLLPASDLPAMLPDCHHILGVILD